MSISKKLSNKFRIISYLYKHLLLESKIDAKESFESGEFSPKEIKIIEGIVKSYDNLEKVSKKFLKSTWSWDRIPPLERAILIYGSYELLIFNKGQTIFELVEITKEYIPGDSYKYINAVLQKIGDYYEQIKSNKK